MKQITTIGLDLAKQVFQVHAAAADGSPIFGRKLTASRSAAVFRKDTRLSGRTGSLRQRALLGARDHERWDTTCA